MNRALLVVLLLATTACRPRSKPAKPDAPGPFVPTLAQLSSNPKALPAKSATPGPDATVYEYGDLQGVTGVVMTVPKDRAGAWRIAMKAPAGSTLTPYHFAKEGGFGGATGMPTEWFEITDGPMKGAVIHAPGYIGSLGSPGWRCTAVDAYSPAYFVTATSVASGERDEKALRKWTCGSGRSGIKGAISARDFLDQCQDAIRKKMLRPDDADFKSLGIEEQVLAAADCSLAWKSSVEGKSGLGRDVEHRFTCLFDPKKGRVEAAIGQ